MTKRKECCKLLSRIAVCFLAASCAIAAKKQLNVVDYLMLLPEKYIGFENMKIPSTERPSMIGENDARNGWLKLTGRGENTFEGWVEMALFNKGPAGPMLGITVNHCGPLCQQRIYFLQYTESAWQEITAEVFQPLAIDQVKELYRSRFPDDENSDDPPVLYRLPRRGTDIVLVTQETITGREVVLARFSLRNGRFIPREP
jgi:hypothetical protein